MGESPQFWSTPKLYFVTSGVIPKASRIIEIQGITAQYQNTKTPMWYD